MPALTEQRDNPERLRMDNMRADADPTFASAQDLFRINRARTQLSAIGTH
jgi:hypothetical protein